MLSLRERDIQGSRTSHGGTCPYFLVSRDFGQWGKTWLVFKLVAHAFEPNTQEANAGGSL